jgi:threonine/homoserine/homoserine lactone efflux protein
MLLDADAATFLAVALLVVITPGPDMALVTAHAVARGRRQAQACALGVCTGALVHGAAAALGVSGVIAASSLAFTVLKLAGGAFLVVLGVRAILQARRERVRPELPPAVPSTRLASSPYWQGFWSNVLNPKVALLFLSMLPQFVDPADPVLAKTLLLSCAFTAMGLVWLLTYAWLISRVATYFRSPRLRAWIETVSGTVLVLLGIRLAVQDR